MVRCYNKYVSFNKEKNICSPSKIRFDRLRVYNICEREKREREREREREIITFIIIKGRKTHP